MRRLFSILAAALTIVGLASCSGSGKTLLPNVSGKAGEVIVVIERADWEGALGDEVRNLLAADCPWLYIREPLYSLVNVPTGAFTELFKVHRNIVIFNIDPQVASSGVIVKNDVWATPQCVIQVSGHDSDEALSILKEKGATVVGAIEQAERDRVINNTLLYEESSIRLALNDIFDGSPHFPSGYKLRMSNDHFSWIEDRKQYVTQGVFVYRYPVPKDDPFTMESIISKRNQMLQENVPGMFENTYMTTADYITPTVEFIKYRGREFAQTRGYWEVYNDFMGGPFVSHSFYSPDGSDIIVLEAFVYAPRYDKRQYLRQVESILYSFEWKKE